MLTLPDFTKFSLISKIFINIPLKIFKLLNVIRKIVIGFNSIPNNLNITSSYLFIKKNQDC